MNKMQSVFLWCIASVFVMLFASSVHAGAEYEASRLKQLRDLYDFRNWPGKDGPIRDGFKLDNESLPTAFRLNRIGEPYPSLGKETGRLSVSRRYTITRADGTGRVFIDVVVCEISADAHECLFKSITGPSIPQPPLMPRGSEIDLNLGDICFGGRGRDGYVGWVSWTRNNVFVDVELSLENMRSDMEEIARAVDEALSRRATCPTYRQCPSRPVITKVERVKDPEERSRLGLKTPFKVVEVKSARGEKMYHRSSSDLFNLGWPVKFPFVISDSNLIGLPKSGIAKWKTEGPDTDQANADTDEFLRKWEP